VGPDAEGARIPSLVVADELAEGSPRLARDVGAVRGIVAEEADREVLVVRRLRAIRRRADAVAAADEHVAVAAEDVGIRQVEPAFLLHVVPLDVPDASRAVRVIGLLVGIHPRVVNGDSTRIVGPQGVATFGRRRAPASPPDDVHGPSIAGARLEPMLEIGSMRVKTGLAEMLKGGVIMDVTDAEQARIAEDAGAVAVMALERVPADIRAEGGVARMADPDKITEIQESVTIPVMAKARIGHFVEAQILEALEVDYIDESEVLTPADTAHHIDKWKFTVPFVCGCTNLGEALRRIAEGAAMIRTKGEAGTGDIVNAVTHMRAVFGAIRRLGAIDSDELYSEAKELRAPYELVRWVAENGKLPVVTFTAGGIASPADAALCMQLGADGVFVGSGIFKSSNPSERAKAIVEATTHYRDADVLARVSRGLGDAMSGLSAAALAPEELLETRGW
jgi:pyridoxal 5'-phosphate synthase pdxS subunit